MGKGCLGKWLVVTQTFQNDGVSSLRVDFDLAVGTSDNCRHALPCRVKLADIQNLEFLRLALDIYEHRSGLSGLELCRELVTEQM